MILTLKRRAIFLSSLQNTKNAGHILVLKSRDFLCLGLLDELQTGVFQSDSEVCTGLLSCRTQNHIKKEMSLFQRQWRKKYPLLTGPLPHKSIGVNIYSSRDRLG